MSTSTQRLIEEYRHQPDLAVHQYLSTVSFSAQAHDPEWRQKATSVLSTVCQQHQPATLEHAYHAWRDDPETHAFAEAVRAIYLRDYRDDGADDAMALGRTLLYEVYGRPIGSAGNPKREAGGSFNPVVKPDDRAMFRATVLPAARRKTKTLRDRGYEGYVVFVDDPTHYDFTPETDFVYP